MKTGNRIVAGAIVGAALLAANSGLSRADEPAIFAMTPLRAASLDVGSRHLVSYFVAAGGLCRLTVMIADAGAPEAPATRLRLAVDPGKAARVDTAEGKSVSFDCANEAREMRVTRLERLAASPDP